MRDSARHRARSVEVIESARSYLENAVGKAVAHARASGLPTLADDSGLEVDALDGGAGGDLGALRRALGPHRRRPHGAAAAPPRGRAPARRERASGRSSRIALPGGRTFVREGIAGRADCLGARGASGFGYDPVFELPDGRTLAEVGEAKQGSAIGPSPSVR